MAAAAEAERAGYAHTKDAFLEEFPRIREELMKDRLLEGMPQNAHHWMQKMLDYNVPGGKLNRGMTVFDVVKALKGDEVTEDLTRKANVVGWCIEFLQAFFLVADDIMDGSITRRGQPCWYKVPEVGLLACNDYIILESCIYRLLKKHFRSEAYYADLLDLFHDTTHQTAHGQLMDIITAPIGTVDLSRYTIDTYMRIVTFKTAFYSFYLPVASGLMLSGYTDPKAFELAQSILIEMGQYFQIQDDYLDCFADPIVLGKIGTDIEDNKCSWLICQALPKASAEQRKVIEECYGKPGPENVGKIKQVYRDLELEQLFQEFEQTSYEKLCAKIEQQALLPKPVFTSLLNRIYKRKK